ncbi:MAG: class I SAM-dependent methyltransferase [Anaerolineaceae bacterium]|nr:class I SAM-dependent methyltransferase [Anaerolineaceae bacterium]
MKYLLRRALSEPLARGLDLDDPKLTEIRKQILRRKRFLRAIYVEWYQLLAGSIPAGPGSVLELGSGSGFAHEYIPNLFTSEVFWLPGLSLVGDGCALPFSKASLKGIVMTDVLHHIPCAMDFFDEAARCLKPGGVVAMVEPWVNTWSAFIYRNLHHEGFFPDAKTWEFESQGPLSGANGALPWILFERDKHEFARQFPSLQVESIAPMMPFSYLLSGGLSMRSIAAGRVYPVWRKAEKWLGRITPEMGMFAFILLRRT